MNPFHDPPVPGGQASQAAALQAVTDNLCARICHDFSGPLGTLLGSLECAMEDGGHPSAAVSDAVRLANDAAHAMVARLRLLRAAWSGPDGDLEPAELLHLLDGLIGRERLQIDVSGLRAAVLPPAMARVLLNVLMLAAEALPAGGQIYVGEAGDGDGRAVVTLIDGPRAAWPSALGACLTDPAAIADRLGKERRLQAPLTALIGQAAGVRLSFLLGAGDRPAPLLLNLG